jgi:hypothetical protein
MVQDFGVEAAASGGPDEVRRRSPDEDSTARMGNIRVLPRTLRASAVDRARSPNLPQSAIRHIACAGALRSAVHGAGWDRRRGRRRRAAAAPCRIFGGVNGSRHAHEIPDFVGSLRPRWPSVRIPSAPPATRPHGGRISSSRDPADPPLPQPLRGRIQRIVLSTLRPNLTAAQDDSPGRT